MKQGGARVAGVIFVLDESIEEVAAGDMLWRRETRRSGRYKPPSVIGENTVVLERLLDFGGLDIVLYTRIQPNIGDLRPERLAELAVSSAKGKAGAERKDGITYLIRAKEAGISTPLMPAYEAAIVSLCRATSLEEAWEVSRSSSSVAE